MRGRTAVVVTGIGAVSSAGKGVNALWNACLSGKSIAESIPDFWLNLAKYKSDVWSALPADIYEGSGFTDSSFRQFDNSTLLAFIALHEALLQAQLTKAAQPCQLLTGSPLAVDPYRSGVILGSSSGGCSATAASVKTHYLAELKRANPDALSTMGAEVRQYLSPFSVSSSMLNASAANIAIALNFKGVNQVISKACSSSTDAIGAAYKAIACGQADIVITGGTECLDKDGGTFRGFDVAKTLVRERRNIYDANRPFDEGSSGFLLGEGGSGIIILESLEHAQKRGVPILAEIMGAESSFDAYNIMMPNPEMTDARSMLQRLFKEAGIEADDVDYYSAHASGSKVSDKLEADMIHDFFGQNTWVSSTKSIIGHTLGASGALSLIVMLCSLRDNMVHPTANLENPIAPLKFAKAPVQDNVDIGVSVSFAFGGYNASVLCKKYKDDGISNTLRG